MMRDEDDDMTCTHIPHPTRRTPLLLGHGVCPESKLPLALDVPILARPQRRQRVPLLRRLRHLAHPFVPPLLELLESLRDRLHLQERGFASGVGSVAVQGLG